MKPILLTILALPIVAFVHHTDPKKLPIDAIVTAQKQTSASQIKPATATTAVQVATVAPAPTKPATPAPAAPAVAVTPPVPTTHEGLMAAAGIPATDYGAVDYIVSHESGWDPDATEPTSGAHGLPQALPYSKTGCGWTDAVCQLQWANNYAVSRYGGWWSAYDYWVEHHNW